MKTRRGAGTAAALLALGLVPIAGGVLRLLQLSGGPALIEADARFDSVPGPIAVHVVASLIFAALGPAQFVPALRRRSWHRRAGRVVAGAGLLAAITALWLTLAYERADGTGDLLYVVRLVFGAAMGAALVLGVRAILRRDVTAHRAWMIRAYALGLGAGTQAVTQGVGPALIGEGVLQTDLEYAAGWLVNLVVAEVVIRYPGWNARRRRRAAVPRTGATVGAAR
ncbi:DUF2306 domain-containing protein [Demequina sp. NBRC 110054]|uniref:DUF2306 domain-containing protein n=1 Tax=Demequina sp. NBRC 110054 TaxID=1570343 RepID=UPI0009FD847F|nr:DUF2306 domain-containing protein [Demequina sp. NBRC 110054]